MSDAAAIKCYSCNLLSRKTAQVKLFPKKLQKNHSGKIIPKNLQKNCSGEIIPPKKTLVVFMRGQKKEKKRSP